MRIILVVFALFATSAFAISVQAVAAGLFRCVDGQGKVSYQDYLCSAGAKERAQIIQGTAVSLDQLERDRATKAAAIKRESDDRAKFQQQKLEADNRATTEREAIKSQAYGARRARAQAREAKVTENERAAAVLLCAGVVQKAAKNPDSVKFESLKPSLASVDYFDENKLTVTLDYHATNSFNAVVPGSVMCTYEPSGDSWKMADAKPMK